MRRTVEEVIEDLQSPSLQESQNVVTVREFTEAMRVCYSRLNYEKFCDLLGMNAYWGKPGSPKAQLDAYAEERWDDFKMLVTKMSILDGGFLAKLVKFGIEYPKDLADV